jgi:formate dehydrogenase subunit delta
MANNIAAFFKSQPVEQQAEGIAGHINMFWEPRMRRELFEAVEKDVGLDPLVVAASEQVNRPQ